MLSLIAASGAAVARCVSRLVAVSLILLACLIVQQLAGQPAAAWAAEVQLQPEPGVEAAPSTEAGPADVNVGAYVLRVSNVSQKDGTFNVDMWVWLRWKRDGISPEKTFEIANGTITSRSDTEIQDDEDYHYTAVRVQALVYHEFDVRRFPIDNHVLAIDIEDSTYDQSTIRYVADRGSALDPGLHVAGWNVSLGTPVVSEHVYPTDYGQRSIGTSQSVYSRLTIPIVLERGGMMVLLKQFWISALAVILALLALLIHSHDLDARFGLGVGSIFAASANAFVLEDNLPKTTSLTLAEQLNLLSVAVIFLSVFVSIWSLRLRYADRPDASLRLDRNALIILGMGYVVMNIAIIAYSALFH